MKGIFRTTALAATVVAASLVVSPAASASTTLGQTIPPGPVASYVCGYPYTYVQAAAAGAPLYAAPADGVITSWSTAANGNSPQTMTLKVLRHDPSNSAKYFTLAKDGPRPLANLLALNTFPNVSSPAPVRIPMKAGDLLGATGSINASCSFASPPAGDQVAVQAVDTAVDPATSVTFQTPTASQRVDIAAVLEPDADHDGYGDETQDLCPANAATHGPCPPTGQRAAALKKCKHKHGKKRKKCKKKARKLPV